MKYKLKEDLPINKLSAINKDVYDKLMKGKEVELDVVPRNLIGKVELVKEKEKKPKKEIK